MNLEQNCYLPASLFRKRRIKKILTFLAKIDTFIYQFDIDYCEGKQKTDDLFLNMDLEYLLGRGYIQNPTHQIFYLPSVYYFKITQKGKDYLREKLPKMRVV